MRRAGVLQHWKAGGLRPAVCGLVVEVGQPGGDLGLFGEAALCRTSCDAVVADVGLGGQQNGQLRAGLGLLGEALDVCVDGLPVEQGEQAGGGEGEPVGEDRALGEGDGDVEAGVQGQVLGGGLDGLLLVSAVPGPQADQRASGRVGEPGELADVTEGMPSA